MHNVVNMVSRDPRTTVREIRGIMLRFIELVNS